MNISKNILLFNQNFGLELRKYVSFGDRIYNLTGNGYAVYLIDYDLIAKEIISDCEFDEQSGLFPSIENILEIMKDKGMIIDCIKQLNGKFFAEISKNGNYSEAQFDDDLRESLLKALNVIIQNDKNN